MEDQENISRRHKCGAKKKDPLDKSIQIIIYKEQHKIDDLGGIEIVKEMLKDEFEFKWKMKKES